MYIYISILEFPSGDLGDFGDFGGSGAPGPPKILKNPENPETPKTPVFTGPEPLREQLQRLNFLVWSPLEALKTRY